MAFTKNNNVPKGKALESIEQRNSNRTKEILYLAFNFVSSIAVTFINKICFSRVDFGFPAALCNVHFLVSALGVEALFRAGLFQKVQPKLKDPEFLIMCFLLGIVNPLNNTSLKLNSIGFYQIFKLLLTPCVVVLEYILDKKLVSRNRSMWLVAVCVSVLISSSASLSFSPYGTLCASFWVPLAAGYKVQWGRLKKKYACSTLGLMRATLPYAIIVQAAISPIVDPPGLLEYEWTTEAIFWIGLSGIFAFLVNFSGFLVMGNISALAHIMLGQMKTAVIMLGATILFSTKYTPIQLIGAMTAVVAIVFYTRETVKENSVQKSELGNGQDLPLIHTNIAK